MCLFVVAVYLLEAEVLTVVRVTLRNVLIAIEPITVLIDVGSCVANIPNLLELLIFLMLLDPPHLLYMTLLFHLLLLTILRLYLDLIMIL